MQQGMFLESIVRNIGNSMYKNNEWSVLATHGSIKNKKNFQ